MKRKIDSMPEQIQQLEAPVSLTPDQIAEAVGGAAVGAVSSFRIEDLIICGGPFLNPSFGLEPVGI
jgi:hypothetical protein